MHATLCTALLTRQNALQVHLFIFFMAIVHILGCIALMLLASMRMNLWERWGEAGDAHARLCVP